METVTDGEGAKPAAANNNQLWMDGLCLPSPEPEWGWFGSSWALWVTDTWAWFGRAVPRFGLGPRSPSKLKDKERRLLNSFIYSFLYSVPMNTEQTV